MRRDQVEQTLRMMERCREFSYEAKSKREAKRLEREYGQMWKSIEPYVSGRVPYSDPNQPPS